MMGAKDVAKKIMIESGVSVVPGYHGADQSEQFLLAKVIQIFILSACFNISLIF